MIGAFIIRRMQHIKENLHPLHDSSPSLCSSDTSTLEDRVLRQSVGCQSDRGLQGQGEGDKSRGIGGDKEVWAWQGDEGEDK